MTQPSQSPTISFIFLTQPFSLQHIKQMHGCKETAGIFNKFIKQIFLILQ